MTRTLLTLLVFAACLAQAAEPKPLTREELGSFKKKLTAIKTALGKPPEGYVMNRDDNSLPTTPQVSESGKFYLLTANSNQGFGGAVKAAQQSQEQLSQEYQKKMMEAASKGDYDTLSKLQQEVQAKAYQGESTAQTARQIEPIDVSIDLNQNQSATLDPDNILFEKPGVIAVREPGAPDDPKQKESVVIYFDPVALKDAKELSTYEFQGGEGGPAYRTAVHNAAIRLTGSAPQVEEWAKRVDVKAVLAQIDKR